jgi:hypothetical protein
MKYVRLLSAAIVWVLMLSAVCVAEDKSDKTAGKKYQYVQVNRFDVAEGVNFPPDYRLTIDEDLNKQLGTIKGMKQVLREGETLPEAEPVLLVTGTITKYSKGNQATRYLVGFGAGSTVIKAHIKCYDVKTKELLLEKDVDGKVVMGVMGGKSEGANNGLAKEIAKNLKQRFF